MRTDLRDAGPSDRDLLTRYRQGDLPAFGMIYDRYATRLLFYAHSLVGDAALAEDLLQECFLRLVDLDPVGVRQDSLSNLLYTILRNLARDEGRKQSTRQRSYPLLASAANPQEEEEQSFEELSRALHGLPPEQREAVLLKAYGDLTFAEIAALLGVSEPTVKSRHRYALEKLGEVLREEDGKS